MKKIRKTLLLVLVLLLNSCGMLTKYEKYVNYKSYSILPIQGMMFNPISNLDINWVSGNITIFESNDYEKVTIIEKVSEEYNSDDFLCHYYRKDDTLFIKYRKSNISIPNKINKSLNVYIPINTTLSAISLKVVSSNVYLSNIKTEKLTVESVSGKIETNDTTIKEMNFETVNSSIMAFVDNNTTNINVDTVGGTTILSISDDINGFDVNFETIGGTFTKDFEVTHLDNNHYTYLDNSLLSINVNSVSGNLSLVKNIINKVNNSRKH